VLSHAQTGARCCGGADLAVRPVPASPWRSGLLYLVATYYDRNSVDEASGSIHEKSAPRFPKGHVCRARILKLAFCAWTGNAIPRRSPDSHAHLQIWPDPKSASACAYWMGRCYEKLGDLPQWHRGSTNVPGSWRTTDFYGRLAAGCGRSKRPGSRDRFAAPTPESKKALICSRA